MSNLKNIPALDWALVVAGAAFGGAILHESRILGGLIVGGAVFAYVYSKAPCCSGCAHSKTPCTGAGVVSAPGAGFVGSAVSEQLATGGIATQGNKTEGWNASDYPGTTPSATLDPASIWQQPAYAPDTQQAEELVASLRQNRVTARNTKCSS